MTRINDTVRLAANTTFDAAFSGTATVALGSAVTLATSAGARPAPCPAALQTADEPATTHRAQQSAAADLGAAFAGSPESFLARIALEMRRSNAAIKEHSIHVEMSGADTAEKAYEAAQAAGKTAAAQATGFLGLGKTFDIVAKVVSVVVSVVSTVFTAGAAAPLAAGLLLFTFGGDLANLAVDAGLCPESLKEELTAAIKLTGAIMVAVCSFGAGAAAIGSVVLEATSSDIVSAAADAFDMSPEAQAALSIGLSVAVTVLAAVAGGASSAGGVANGATQAALASARSFDRAVTVGARVASAATDVGAAVSNHDAANSRADARLASANREGAYDQADVQLAELKTTLRAYGRAMKLARQAQEARGQALRAATRQRA